MIELFGKKVENFDKLPILSESVMKLFDLLDDVNSTNKEIARIISLDGILVAKILSLANSPIYAGNKSVGDILQAIMKLGRAEIKNLMITIKMSGVLGKINLKNINMDMYWRHSLSTAFLSNKLMQEYLKPKHFPAENKSSYYIAGLLHDLGLILYDILDPEAFNKIEKMAMDEKIILAEAELEETDFVHSKEGAKLLKEMGLPDSITVPVYYHHNSEDCLEFKKISEIVDLADTLSNVFNYYPVSSERNDVLKLEILGFTTLSDLSIEDLDIKLESLKNDTEMFMSFASLMLGKK